VLKGYGYSMGANRRKVLEEEIFRKVKQLSEVNLQILIMFANGLLRNKRN
jgi:hypothetical protein